MQSSMYRFRKIEHLLDKGELENQEIYFSDIASLNDPMEGFREIYWKGDSILWKNLIKHYLLCLENAIMLSNLSDEQKNFSQEDISVFLSAEKLPTEKYRNVFHEICNIFFNYEGMSKYLEILACCSDGITRDELYVHFKIIHRIAIDSIIKTHVAHELQPAPDNPVPDYPDLLKKLLPILENLRTDREKEQEKISILCSTLKQTMREMDLVYAYNLKLKGPGNKQYFIFHEFPNAYIDYIEKLTYHEAYVACFMENCTSFVVWSHYGDSHKGVSLKFKNKFIDLYGIVGIQSGGKHVYDKRKFPFKEIVYSNTFPKINFFASIGRLPVSQIMSQWYTDVDGNKSIYADELLDGANMENWRQAYWEQYEKSFLTKLKDWEYEAEFRLLLTDMLDMRVEKNTRKLKYDFHDLEGIVFGIKTPLEAKLKIINIIEEKCKKANRQDFAFYQAQYSASTGEIKVFRMNMLKFK